MKYIWDEKLNKLVEVSERKISHEGLTVIPDEPEFISRDAFPETVKWTGRRSKKRIMKRYNCVDYRDIKGVGKEKARNRERAREASSKPYIRTDIDLIKEKTIEGRKETRRKYFFTGR